MLAQLGAILATVRTVVERLFETRYRVLIAMVASTLALVGCLPTTAPLAGADPADPRARVAGAGYRSSTAPYTGLRPTTPLSWREQNDRVAPAPKSDR
jgi:hypothetical protein